MDDDEWKESIVMYLDECSLSNYSTPYLTCCLCNCINFINVTLIRGIKNKLKSSNLFEYLKPCCGCGYTKYLRTGANSYQTEIDQAIYVNEELEKRRIPAAIDIQRVARGRLGRIEAKRRRIARELYERKIYHAATSIQTRVRGFQARTRAEIERCIFVILNAHPFVYTYAITNRPHLPTIFWYDSEEELDVFRFNYREFVYRTGGRPPLWRVEANVREITRRVLLKENTLVARIQARWRGITARVSFTELKRQLGYTRTTRHSPVVKIQRVLRMHKSRRRCYSLRSHVGRDIQMAQYRQYHEEIQLAKKHRAYQASLLVKYREECKKKRSTMVMGPRIDPNSLKTTIISNQTQQTKQRQHKNRFIQAKTKLDIIIKRKNGSFPNHLRTQVIDSNEYERMES